HTTRYTLDGTEPDASSPVYNEPFQVEKTTVVKAKSFDAQGNVSPVSVAYFRIVPSDKSHGVKTTFYNLNAPEKLPVFEKLRGDRLGMNGKLPLMKRKSWLYFSRGIPVSVW